MSSASEAVVERALQKLRASGAVAADCMLIESDSLYLFWWAMEGAAWSNILIPAVLCAGVLASDRRTGALQLYFSRPVTRHEYLVAKGLTVAAFCGLLLLRQ